MDLRDGGEVGMNRIEDIKMKYPYAYYSDSSFRIAKEDMKYLLRIAEAAEQTVSMLQACKGRPVDETATLFLEKAINDEHGSNKDDRQSDCVDQQR